MCNRIDEFDLLLPSLAKRLSQLSSLLEELGESHWAEWLRHDSVLLADSNPEGLDHFLSALGGMGSLNDLVICRVNGHRVDKTDESKINLEVQQLLSECRERASELSKLT